MKRLSGFCKLSLFGLIFCCFFIHLTVFRAIIKKHRLKHTNKWTARYCRFALQVLGIKLQIKTNSRCGKRQSQNRPQEALISKNSNQNAEVGKTTNSFGLKENHDIISLSARLSPLTRRFFSSEKWEGGLSAESAKKELRGNKEVQTKLGAKPENFLIVSNHASWLDVLILYSLLENPCFVTSRDIQSTFFFGVITKYSNCCALDRRRKKRLKEDIKAVTYRLFSGQNVILFPEGTTGDGKKLLKFKSPVFDSALQAKKRVRPVCINCLSIDGKPLSGKNKDRVFWHGGSSFLKHFIGLCQIRQVEYEIVFTPPLPTKDTNRRELALKAFHQIEREFKPAL